MARRGFIAGNWKMHGRLADVTKARTVAEGARSMTGVDVAICPPATLVAAMVQGATSGLIIGAQDCSPKPDGAHTGDLSATMLRDAGASVVILGHSERRCDHGEGDELVCAKAAAAIAAGLSPIVCVGETLAQRQSGATLAVVLNQVSRSIPDGVADLVVAYEPVWAIGTGLTPSVAQIGEVHAAIRQALKDRFAFGEQVRILYGGSVKAANAREIFQIENVDGALVGGASLEPAEFLAIAAAHPQAA